MNREIFYLTYPKVGKLIREKNITRAILPVGTVEAHGPHLPLGTDTIIPHELAKALADKLNALILPPVTYGVVTSLLGHPGSVTISRETLEAMIYEIITSFSRHGIDTFIILNGHGGTNVALEGVVRRLWVEKKLKVILIHWWIFASDLTMDVLKEPAGHAGIDETAAIIATHPDLVDKDADIESEIFLHKKGLSVYPNPGSIFLYDKEKRGKPKFDEKLANEYWNQLINYIYEQVSQILVKWEQK
ncbi:MAG: creatininase family protein [Candidatus Asgardarchaeia archaeon]